MKTVMSCDKVTNMVDYLPSLFCRVRSYRYANPTPNTGDEIIYENTQVKDAKLVLTPNASLASKSVRSVVSETNRKSFSNRSSLNRTATRSKFSNERHSGED